MVPEEKHSLVKKDWGSFRCYNNRVNQIHTSQLRPSMNSEPLPPTTAHHHHHLPLACSLPANLPNVHPSIAQSSICNPNSFNKTYNAIIQYCRLVLGNIAWSEIVPFSKISWKKNFCPTLLFRSSLVFSIPQGTCKWGSVPVIKATKNDRFPWNLLRCPALLHPMLMSWRKTYVQLYCVVSSLVFLAIPKGK